MHSHVCSGCWIFSVFQVFPLLCYASIQSASAEGIALHPSITLPDLLLLPQHSHYLSFGCTYYRFQLFVLLLFMQFMFKKIVVSVNKYRYVCHIITVNSSSLHCHVFKRINLNLT